MTLLPAYGRDYKSKKAAQADFDAGKDFIIADISSPWNGKPVNKVQLKEEGQNEVSIRYKQMTQIAVIKIK